MSLSSGCECSKRRSVVCCSNSYSCARRRFCWSRVHPSAGLAGFFNDRYHNLDAAVVLLDIVMIALTISADGAGVDGGAQGLSKGGKAGRLVKLLKGVRFAKLLRVLRVAKVVHALEGKSILHAESRVRKLVAGHQWLFLA